MVSQDTLVTTFRLDASGYASQAWKATAATNAFASAAQKAQASLKQYQAQFQAASRVAKVTPSSGALGNVAAAVQAFGRGANFNAIAQAQARQGMGFQGGQSAAALSVLKGGGGSFGNSGAFSTPTIKGASQALSNSPFKTWRKDASDFFDSVKERAQRVAQDLAPLRSVAAGIFGVGVAGAVGGFSLGQQAADFDSLRQSLVAVEGSGRAAANELKRLKEIAKAPGIGFEEAVRGYAGLRNAGFDGKYVETILKEFANANVRGGGNAETFGRIITQIRQSANRRFLAQEDLNSISEAGIPINTILQKRFGTGNTEDLQKKGVSAEMAIRGVVEELAKLSRVAGGAKNEFDNAGDAWKFAAVAAGDGINQSLLPLVNTFSTAVSTLGEGGEIEAAFSTAAANIAEIFGTTSDSVADSLREVLGGIEDASAGFRNLAENLTGFGKGVSSVWDWLTTPLGGNAQQKATDEFDDSLAAERNRNAYSRQREKEAAETFRRRDQDDADIKKAGFKGSRSQWRALTQEQRDAMLKGNGTTGAKDAKKDATTLLGELVDTNKLIAVNTGRMADRLEDAESGGGSRARDAGSPIELSNVVGGFNRRFRRGA